MLIAGIGRESVKATVELAQAAVGFGYDAVLVRNPCYYRPQLTHEALLHYFRTTVADRSPLPVILYSIPKFTQAEIPLEVVAELAQHPNILGLKESSGSVGAGAECGAGDAACSATDCHRDSDLYEAVTGRMLATKPASSGNFISAEGFGVRRRRRGSAGSCAACASPEDSNP